MTPDSNSNQTPETQSQPSNDMAAFSYVWIMAIFVLVFRRDDAFAQFHARQAAVLFFLSLFVWLIPWIGNFLEILVAAMMIFGFIQASQGHKFSFPLIGDLVAGKVDFDQIRSKFSQKSSPDSSPKNPEPKSETPEPESEEEKRQHRKELADSLITPPSDSKSDS